MKVLKKILIGLALLGGLLVVVGLFLPARVHVERSAVIKASPSTIFTLVNGFRSFTLWSPWYERDPDANYTLEGPDFGVGARHVWVSAKPDVGSGSQEITVSEPYRKVITNLDFGDEGLAEASFDLEPVEGGTRVIWGLDTDFGFSLPGRYVGLFFDRMIGPDYEKGLASLKTLAESLPPADFSDLKVENVEVKPALIAYLTQTSAPTGDAIGTALASAYGLIGNYMATNGLEQAGAPLSIRYAEGTQDGKFTFDSGIPVKAAVAGGVGLVNPNAPHDAVASPALASTVKQTETYGGAALKVVHTGPYNKLTETHAKLKAYVAAHQIEAVGRIWEVYVSDPGETPEDKLETHIFLPLGS